MTGVLLSIAALAAAGLLYLLVFVGHRDKRLPPGPPTLPIIGNLHQIPKKGSYLKFTEWAQTYGGFYSLKLGPATAVVLTDRRLVKELLDKKSGKYSNRPYSHVSTELMTKGDHVLIMQYGDLWRKCRKLIHQSFMETKCDAAYIPTQNAEALQMMRDFALHPEQHMLHPKRYSNSIIMSLLFGIRTPDVHTPHMEKLYAMMENWSQLMEPGNTPPVDIFPFLHWVPESWLGRWVSRSKDVGAEMSALYSGMLELVQARRAEGVNRKCFTDVVLDQNEKIGLSQHELYFLVGTMMEGGSDTTSSIVIAWVQAMTRWGDVLRKAQEEIDGLMGEERSPVWEDYERLPYVAQMVKEAMRWRPVVPTAFPHALAEDDWVDGHFLPKGTIVIINVWGLHHDSKHFPNPDVFDPAHYANCTTLAPELASSADYAARDHYAYGAGRRICPGMHLAERNLFLAIAKLAWGFAISPKMTGAGEEVRVDVDPATGYSEGFLVCARPFESEIRPRGQGRRDTILREFAAAERDVLSQYAAPPGTWGWS